MHQWFKSATWTLFNHTGLDRLVETRYAGRGVVLLLHRVVPDPEAHLQSGIATSTRFLHDCVTWLRSQGYEIISMSDAMSRLGNVDKPRFAVLTFDDGYRDNLTEALPVLETLNAPFTLYVATDMVTRGLFAWWLGLEELFLYHDRVELEGLAASITCRNRVDKMAALAATIDWVKDDHRRVEGLRSAFASYGIDVEALLDRDALSEIDLRTMAGHPLVTIGGHTCSHRALSSLADEPARREIVDNREFLEKLIGNPVTHFAYPFGNVWACGHRDAMLVRDAGYHTAVTTRTGLVFPGHRQQPFAIPRIGLDNRDTLRSLACKVRGVTAMLRTGLGNPEVYM